MLIVDNTRPVLAAIRERGISIDPDYAGECRQLFGNRGIALQYRRRDGLTVDGVSELLWDRGFTLERLSPAATLAMLEDLLTPAPVAPSRARKSSRGIAAAEHKARTNRLRKFACSCGQIARGTRNSMLICGLCFETSGEVVYMRRVDPLPEEIMEAACR